MNFIFPFIKKNWVWLVELLILAYVTLVITMEIQIILSSQSMKNQIQPKITEIWIVGKPGNGLGELSNPLGLAVGKDGYIYISDRGNKRVQMFSADGKVIKAWSGDDSASHPFVDPGGLGVHPVDGSIWILDSGNGWIYKLEPGGKMEAVIDGANLGLYSPRGLAVAGNGDLFIADTGGARILHLKANGNLINEWGKLGTGEGEFRDPTGITIQDNKVYICDVGNRRISVYQPDGKRINSWKTYGNYSWITLDDQGRIFSSNFKTREISIYTQSGKLLGLLKPNKDIRSIEGLTGIAVTPDGKIIAAGSNEIVSEKIDW